MNSQDCRDLSASFHAHVPISASQQVSGVIVLWPLQGAHSRLFVCLYYFSLGRIWAAASSRNTVLGMASCRLRHPAITANKFMKQADFQITSARWNLKVERFHSTHLPWVFSVSYG